jgi:hypothetical protein
MQSSRIDLALAFYGFRAITGSRDEVRDVLDQAV